MKTLIATLLFVTTAAFAQTPLKLSTKPSDKIKICKANGQSFPIKNSDDQASCDQLKKPNPKGNSTPPSQPIASPNPISAPPTGN